MQNEMKTIEFLYCHQCNLATPSWRSRCIHCRSQLSSPSLPRENRNRPDSSENASESVVRAPSA